MEAIYYVVRIIAVLWVFMTLFMVMLGGCLAQNHDHLSTLAMGIGLSLVLPVIKNTADAGSAVPGSFTWGFPLVSYFGFALIFFGLVLHWVGITSLGKQWSAVVAIKTDHKLVETGIYKYIRHPIYAGILLEILGMGVALANWQTILALMLPNLLSVAYRIFVEERALREYFGEVYIQYSHKTSRLIPKIL